MGTTSIQWTEYNWNPFTGCTAVSPGCVNCYARKNARRLKGNPFTDKYKDEFKFRFHPEYLDEPLKWKKPHKIFVNTMSDTFHEDAPLEAIQQIFERMVKCPQHIFQVLTKRAERMAELSANLPWSDNVWAGVTVENADYLHRLDFLRQVPARVRFISFEPLLSPIPTINFRGIHWVIVGGESGPKARPMDLDWARDIRDQCLRARVPFFFKQVGGKSRDKGGRLMDGKEWNEYPDTGDTATHESDDPDTEGQTSFAEQHGLRPLSDAEGEKQPMIEFISRENPHPSLKAPKKEVAEMPKETNSPASAKKDTVKKGSADAQVQLIPPDKFQAEIDALRQASTIKNDKGEEVAFEGETKDVFIKFSQEAYPIAEKMLETIYETGRFLYEARRVLKPKKLFLRWLEFTGFRDRRYYRYMKVYGSFRDKLPQFSGLGIRKLEAASRLKNPIEYLEEHREDAEKQTVKEFEQTVRKVRASGKKGGRGRPPSYEVIAGCRVHQSKDGKRIMVEGLSKKKQSALFEAIKAALSKKKG